MKVSVLQENLNKALATANRFVNNRAQLPVLSNVLLNASKNKLIISSTNLETSVSISTGAKASEEGKITVPARVISDLVSNLNSGSIDISEGKERVSIKSQGFKSTLSGMNASDFPEIPQSVKKGSVKVSADKLSESLDKVLFSVSTDETRPVLTGVLFIMGKRRSMLVATDGFRLSQKKIDIKITEEDKFIVPKNALSDLARLSGEVDEVDFSFGGGESQVIFGVGDVVLASRLIEGEFPDFEKIIPKSSEYKVGCDKEELLRAVRLASVFARDSANVIKLIIKKDSVVISGESKQTGSQEKEIDAKVEGPKDELEIAFNYKFLEDFLNAVEGEDVVMEFSDANAPGIFTDPKVSDFLHLIMPIRIQS